MNFYSMSLLLEFDHKELLEIATRIFGNCDEFYTDVNCVFRNRDIELTYYPHEKLVGVMFHFLEPPARFSEDPDFPTGRELQPGTMEAIKKFGELAKELKKHNIGITYRTEGRRIDLYKKVMEKAGLRGTPLGWHTGVETGEWVWR